MSCPVGYTCPTIDGVIETLQQSVDSLGNIIDDLSPVVQEKYTEALANVLSNLEDLYGHRRSSLEQIREANACLREWGEKMEEERDEYIEELRNVDT